jgi:oligopeptidase B
MESTEVLQDVLYQEMRARIKEDDATAPFPFGDYIYYSRTEENKQYSIHVRKKKEGNEKEKITLDMNSFADTHDYVSLGAHAVSPNQKLLAYAIDYDGSEKYVLKIKTIENGREFSDELTNLSGSIEWANDSKTLFYVSQDDASRPYQVWRHILGTRQAEDKMIYEEKSDAYHVYLSRSKSGKFLFISLESNITSEYWFLDRDNPNGQFQILQKRRVGVEYTPYHQGDRFLIRTNDESLNFKLVSAPVGAPQRQNWVDALPHRSEVKIEDMEVFQDYVVVFERKNGNVDINIYPPDLSSFHTINLPDVLYETGSDTNLEYDTDILRIYFSSFTIPWSYYDYHMESEKLELIKRDSVLGGYDPSQYESKRLFAESHDGKKIPLSLFYKKGLDLTNGNPLFLDGYGSYGATYDPAFSSRRISLVDRDVIYVRAHVRGSSFLGRAWYENGKMGQKQNTFSDFISSAEYLIEEKITKAEKIVIYGGSAGGLLIGAVLNQRPDLFKGAIADVPFVDVVNTMLDETIPLTVIEYDEWGNPNELDAYKDMIAYSPYDNVVEQDYPSILVIAGLNDPRVGYWEPAKWVAKLRDKKTDENLLILKTHMGAGHFSSSGRFDYLKDIAFYYAFALDQFGIEK